MNNPDYTEGWTSRPICTDCFTALRGPRREPFRLTGQVAELCVLCGHQAEPPIPMRMWGLKHIEDGESIDWPNNDARLRDTQKGAEGVDAGDAEG